MKNKKELRRQKRERANELLEAWNEATTPNKLLDDLDYTIIANIHDSILNLYKDLDDCKDDNTKNGIINNYLYVLRVQLKLIDYDIKPILKPCNTLDEKLQAISFILSDVGRYIDYKKGYYDNLPLLDY